MLTDRDAAFCIGSTSEGRAILAPEWVDLATLLGVVPKACRPYRAKTKGKVERMVRELKESFLPWLSRPAAAASPTVADYDALARRWIQEVVLQRRHRTTGASSATAWAEERPLLDAAARAVLATYTGATSTVLARLPVDIDRSASSATGRPDRGRSPTTRWPPSERLEATTLPAPAGAPQPTSA